MIANVDSSVIRSLFKIFNGEEDLDAEIFKGDVVLELTTFSAHFEFTLFCPFTFTWLPALSCASHN